MRNIDDKDIDVTWRLGPVTTATLASQHRHAGQTADAMSAGKMEDLLVTVPMVRLMTDDHASAPPTSKAASMAASVSGQKRLAAETPTIQPQRKCRVRYDARAQA